MFELISLDARKDFLGLMHEEQTCHTLIKGDIAHLASLEEIFWRQESRVLFVKEGDNNTCFFHQVANSHRELIILEEGWMVFYMRMR